MPVFHYQGQRDDGTLARGEVFAATAERASALLQRTSLQVLELLQKNTDDTTRTGEEQEDPAASRVGHIQITDDLVAAIRAYIAERPPVGQRWYFGRLVKQLEKSRTSGQDRPETRHDRPLPWVTDDPSRWQANVVAAAIRHGQEQLDRTRLLWLPLLYPLFLMSITVAVVLLINMLFRPGLVQLLRDFEIELPAITQIMFLWRGLPILIAGFLLLPVILWLLWRITGGAIVRPLPWLGKMATQAYQADFLRRLSAAVMEGQSPPQAARTAADGSRCRSIQRAVRQWSRTDPPADANLRSYGSDFPAVARYALEADIPTIERARLIRELANDRQSAVHDRLFGLSGILEPIGMLVVCVVVFFIVLAAYLPLISLIQNLS